MALTNLQQRTEYYRKELVGLEQREIGAIDENNRTDQSSIAILYRGMHERIIFIDKDHNLLLENFLKLLCDDP